jgi:hypothetical protein
MTEGRWSRLPEITDDGTTPWDSRLLDAPDCLRAPHVSDEAAIEDRSGIRVGEVGSGASSDRPAR